MASKDMQIFLASFLLITITAASNSEEIVVEGTESKVASLPINPYPLPNPQNKAPPPPPTPLYRPVVRAPPPPPPSPVKVSPPPPLLPPPPPPPLIRSPPRNTRECFPLCGVRCKLHSRKNVCLRACVTCCDRCKCVPPGQYGNKEKCGKCYANMTTSRGRPKCP